MIESWAGSVCWVRHDPGHESEVPVAVITMPSGGTFPVQIVGPFALDSIGRSVRRMRLKLKNLTSLNICSSHRSSDRRLYNEIAQLIGQLIIASRESQIAH